jgi:hypothetical protein
VRIVAAGDAAGGFSVVADLLSAGKDVRQVLRTVSERFRDLLAVRVGASSHDTEIVESPSLRELSKLFSPAALLRILGALSEAERDIRWNTQHRLLLETTFLRLMELPQESTAVVHAHASARPAPSETPSAGRTTAPEAARAERTATPEPTKAAAPEEHPAPVQRNVGTAPVRPPVESVPFDLEDEPEDEEDLPYVTDLDDDMPVTASSSGRDLLGDDDLLQLQQVSVDETAPIAAPVKPAVTPGQPAALQKLQRSWQEVINRMTGRSPSGGTIVKDAAPIQLDGTVFLLRFSSRFHIDRLEKNDKGRKALEEIINKTLDAPPGTYKIRCVLAGQEPQRPASAPAARGQGETSAAGPRAQSEAPPAAPRGHAETPAATPHSHAGTSAAAMRGQAEAPPALAPFPDPDSDLVEDVIAVFGGRIIEDDAKGY